MDSRRRPSRAGTPRRGTACAALLAALLWTSASAGAEPGIRVYPAGGLSAESAALLMSGQQGGDLGWVALVLPHPRGNLASAVSLFLEIDGSPLLAGQPDDALQLEIDAYVLEPDGAVAASLLRVIEVDLRTLLPRVLATGIKFHTELALEPGPYELRLLLRNRKTGGLALSSIPLTVPDRRHGAQLLLPPLFHDPDDAWLVIADDPRSKAFEGWSRLGLPSAHPLVGGAAPLIILTSTPIDRGALALELARPDGSVERLSLAPGLQHPSPIDGLEQIVSRVDLSGLAPGEYEMSLTVQARRLRSPGLPVVLGGEKANEHVWAELTQPTSDETAEPAPDVEVQTGRRLAIPRSEVEERLAAALRLLAAGDQRAAAAAFVAFEDEALGGSGSALPALGRVELKFLHELSRSDSDVLLPLLLLYERLYHQHRTAGRFLLSTHARIMMSNLVSVFVKQSSDPEAQKIASRFLTHLAGTLFQLGLEPFAMQLMDRSLELDSGNAIALLTLATGFERRGTYETAIYYLQQLIDLVPDHPEARLRLALLKRRQGEPKRARALLSELAAEEGTGWPLNLAHQELAALQLAGGDLGGAAAALGRALGRWPGDEKLLLLQALLHDLERRPAESREVLLRVEAGAGGGSSRSRYGQLPLDELESVSRELEELVVARHSALATALGLEASP